MKSRAVYFKLPNSSDDRALVEYTLDKPIVMWSIPDVPHILMGLYGYLFKPA